MHRRLLLLAASLVVPSALAHQGHVDPASVTDPRDHAALPWVLLAPGQGLDLPLSDALVPGGLRFQGDVVLGLDLTARGPADAARLIEAWPGAAGSLWIERLAWCTDAVQRSLRKARTPALSVVLLGPGEPGDLACIAQASARALHVGLEVPGPGDAELLGGLKNLRSVGVPDGHPGLALDEGVRTVTLGARATVDAGGPPRHHAPGDAGALVRLTESGALVVGLDLSGAELSERDLAALAGLPLLEDLSLAGLPLAALPAGLDELPGLRRLDLSGTGLGLADLPAAWPGLTDLAVRGAPLRRRDLADLDERLPDLTRLDLRGTRLAPVLPGVEVLTGPLPSDP